MSVNCNATHISLRLSSKGCLEIKKQMTFRILIPWNIHLLFSLKRKLKKTEKTPFKFFIIDTFVILNFIVFLTPSSLSFSVTCKKYMGGKLTQHRHQILCRVQFLPITFKQPTPTPTSLHPLFSPVSCHLRKI